MHWLLRAALLVNTILAMTVAWMFAISVEHQYPSGADGEISVASISNGSHGDTLAESAARHNVVLAQVTHAAEDGQPHRVIALLTHGAELGSTDAPTADQPYPDYGFNATTVVETLDTSDPSALGRWIAYGDHGNIRALITDLTEAGLGVSGELVTASSLASLYFTSPLWMMQAAGLAITFVAALVSASATTRIRAVQSLHGRRWALTIGQEALRYGVFAIAAGAAGWLVWTVVGLLAWSGGQTFGFAGGVFTAAVAIPVAIAVAVCTAAVILTALLVSRILDQVKGRRPLGLIFWAAAATLLVTTTGSFIGLGFAQSSSAQASAARATAERQLAAPDGYTISLWGSAESAVHKVLPAWRSFIDAADQSGNLLLSAYESRCSLIATQRPCVIVNETGAKALGIAQDVEAASGVRLLAPENARVDLPALTASVQQRLELEQSLDELDQIPTPRAGAVEIQTSTLPDGYTIDLFTTGSPVEADTTVTNPVVLIVPVEVISANTHYSWTSQGAERFLYPSKRALTETLREHDAGDLVSSIERPEDAATARLIESNRMLTQYAVISTVTLAGVLVLGTLLATVYCERRRQPLFVEHVHGAPILQRYGSHFVLLIAVSTVALLLVPGANLAAWSLRAGVVLLLLLASAITLFVRDRTLRADTIKHP